MNIAWLRRPLNDEFHFCGPQGRFLLPRCRTATHCALDRGRSELIWDIEKQRLPHFTVWLADYCWFHQESSKEWQDSSAYSNRPTPIKNRFPLLVEETENAIGMDAWGCRTFDQTIEAAISAKAP